MRYIVDSHCHLNYEGLVEEQGDVIARARSAGVGCMLAINTKLKEYHEILAVAEAHNDVYGTVGIHPHEAENEPDVATDILVEKSHHPRIVGLGETGLDYFYDNAPREMQKVNFEAHLRAGQQTGLPVIIHTRDADDDCGDMLEAAMAEAPFKAVIHCFTAGPELARRVLNLGLYISISGIVTFKKAEELREVAKSIPLDRLLVETDSPFLAPVPHRGKTCEPAFVMDTARFLAELRGEDFDHFAAATTQNFFTLFDKAARPEEAAA